MKSSTAELLQWSPSELADHLTGRLLGKRPRPSRSFAPQLAYGRHRGPARRSSRIAAVAITLFQHPQFGWAIPLTLRPTALMHHGGQICFPGGRVEPGESMLQAAVREYTEELGIQPCVHQACGELATHYVYASDNQVHPVVIVTDPPSQAWIPDPAEVDEVILLPVSQLIDPDRRSKISHRPLVLAENGNRVGQVKFHAPAIEVHDQGRVHHVWGATAMMLHQLAQLLHY